MNSVRLMRRLPAVVAAAGCLLAVPAEAHTMISPNSPFAGGLKHFIVSFDDILMAIAAGILAAETEPRVALRAVGTLALAWLVAGLAGVALGPLPAAAGHAGSVALVLVGLLAAWDRRLPPALVLAVVAIAGAIHGLLNGAGMQAPGYRAGALQLLGISCAVAFVSFYPTVLLELVRRTWARLVARVIASWLAATGLLLLGWAFRVPR